MSASALLKRKQPSCQALLDPLTLIISNALIPVLSLVAASSEALALTFCYACLILALMRLWRRLVLFVIAATGIAGLYWASYAVLNNANLVLLTRMFMMIGPCCLIASALVTEYQPSETLSALQRLHIPRALTIGLVVTLRYLPTFWREFRVIRQAMKSRGIALSWRHPLRCFELVMVPQLFRCQALSLELTQAGLTKGITAPTRRTSYVEHSFGLIDALLLIGLLVAWVLLAGRVL